MTQPPITINLIKIPVTTLTTALPFYQTLFAAEPDFAAAEYGWAQFTVGGQSFCLYQQGMGGGRGQAGTVDSVHFAVPDLQAAYDRLRAAGLAVPGGIETSAGGGAFFDIEDPDGNLFKFVQRAG